jgi:hypothetical protein
VLHDSLEVSNAHSPTASRTASSAARSRYYSDNIRFQSVIGQGRFSTVWKVNCVNEVSHLADNRLTIIFKAEDFCVKEFNTSESSSWRQEKSVLGTFFEQSEKFTLQFNS